MDKDTYDKIHRVFIPYDWATMQGFVGIMKECRDYNLQPTDVIEYVIDQVYLRAQSSQNMVNLQRSVNSFDMRCPDCGSKLTLHPVNTNRATNIGGGYKSVLACIDVMGCGWENFSKKSTLEVAGAKVNKVKKPFHGMPYERKTTNKL